jgi:hypothetical protein
MEENPMPVTFLTVTQRKSYGRYTGAPCDDDLVIFTWTMRIVREFYRNEATIADLDLLYNSQRFVFLERSWMI